MQKRLSEPDLKFLVETVATRRRDHEHIMALVRDKEDLLEQMLEDPKLVERLLTEEEALLRVSPYMLFSVLLRQVRRELETKAFVYEPEAKGKRVAVFEGAAVGEILSNSTSRDYLVEMLCSFVKTRTGVVYWRERGNWQSRRFNDTNIDDMIALATLVEPDLRPRYYQRVAEIALFISGIFPEHPIRTAARPRSSLSTDRSLQEYEHEGRRFYGLAARTLADPVLQPVFETLSEKFTPARAALNTLSDRYLKSQRTRYFGLS